MKQRPNILYIMTDQMNANCMGHAGSQVRTPVLDQLSKEGVSFQHAYCNYPVCGPSRATFITGQYPRTHGILGNNTWHEDIDPPPTMPITFKKSGYQTAMVGKSHMIGKWDKEGFDYAKYCDMTDGDWSDPMSNDYFKHLMDHGLADVFDLHDQKDKDGFTSEIPSEHFLETWTGDQALDFLSIRDERRPFFMHLSFQRPHNPLTVPKDRGLLYDPQEIELPSSTDDLFLNRFAGKPAEMQSRLDRKKGSPYVPRDEFDLKTMLAYYYTLITLIDEQIGRVIDHLKQTGEYDNTVIVFTSDHGDFAGEHGLMFKEMGIYESIHRIPFILKYPEGKQNVTYNALIESVDLFPTLCELADVETPNEVEGTSLMSVIHQDHPGKEAVFCQRALHRQMAVRTKRYRMVYNGRNEEGELYDVQTDPHEINNLYEHPDYQNIRIECLEMIMDHVKHYGAKLTPHEDQKSSHLHRNSMKRMMHKRQVSWDQLKNLYIDGR